MSAQRIARLLVASALFSPALLTGQSLRTLSTFRDTTLVPVKVTTNEKSSLQRIGKYSVFADGNLKDVLKGKDGASTPSGSLGVSISSGSIAGSFMVNAVGTTAPLEADFGSALLAPATGNGLSAGLLEVRFALSRSSMMGLCGHNGIRMYGSVSSARWKRSKDDTVHVGAVVPGGGVGAYCQILDHNEPAEGDREARSIGVAIDVGMALRGIGGDIAHVSNDTLRTRLLSTNTRSFVGLEIGLAVQYNGLKAGLTYYHFPKNLPGFSRGQVVAGFSVEAALVSGVFTREVSEERKKVLPVRN